MRSRIFAHDQLSLSPPCTLRELSTFLSPTLSPAPIPSAVDPHTVERAWFMASRWSAPLYERPGRHGPRLLGSDWVDGGWDGSSLRTPPTDPQSEAAPPPSRCRPIPRRRHCSDRGRDV